MTEDSVHHGHRDSVLLCVLNFRKRQNGEVSNVCQQIKDDHAAAAHHERAHEIFSWVTYFAADEGDIGPGGLREERTDHRFSKKQQESESAHECETGLRNLWAPAVCPRIPPRRS